MSVVRGVKIVDPDGAVRIYEAAREIRKDGYGDYELLGARGELLATRKRDTVTEVEILFA